MKCIELFIKVIISGRTSGMSYHKTNLIWWYLLADFWIWCDGLHSRSILFVQYSCWSMTCNDLGSGHCIPLHDARGLKQLFHVLTMDSSVVLFHTTSISEEIHAMEWHFKVVLTHRVKRCLLGAETRFYLVCLNREAQTCHGNSE